MRIRRKDKWLRCGDNVTQQNISDALCKIGQSKKRLMVVENAMIQALLLQERFEEQLPHQIVHGMKRR